MSLSGAFDSRKLASLGKSDLICFTRMGSSDLSMFFGKVPDRNKDWALDLCWRNVKRKLDVTNWPRLKCRQETAGSANSAHASLSSCTITALTSSVQPVFVLNPDDLWSLNYILLITESVQPERKRVLFLGARRAVAPWAVRKVQEKNPQWRKLIFSLHKT